MSVARAWLTEVRGDRRTRWAAVAAGVALGLAVACVHWLGVVLGGALVGLVSKTAARAVLAGLAFGLLSWAVFAALLAANGGAVEYAATGRLLYLSLGIPVGGALLGSLIRGVV